ncbi:hypothetical protein PROFUN_05559 [Planoprotostelium fungivorum]|uniref:Uncharacterized protein n=1 Tax=Planoprotostelium fungivorum TaxID=1890364 RepID=A0A2P6N054_9EUKA|nr:hypothetical protein PROFUN_05559 [Planoprotostelium fungivorum]
MCSGFDKVISSLDLRRDGSAEPVTKTIKNGFTRTYVMDVTSTHMPVPSVLCGIRSKSRHQSLMVQRVILHDVLNIGVEPWIRLSRNYRSICVAPECLESHDTRRGQSFVKHARHGKTSILFDFSPTWIIVYSEEDGDTKRAARKKHIETVRLLLSDPRVDPSAKDNEIIALASTSGHTEVTPGMRPSCRHPFRLLLSDLRVDPSTEYNQPSNPWPWIAPVTHYRDQADADNGLRRDEKGDYDLKRKHRLSLQLAYYH